MFWPLSTPDIWLRGASGTMVPPGSLYSECSSALVNCSWPGIWLSVQFAVASDWEAILEQLGNTGLDHL